MICSFFQLLAKTVLRRDVQEISKPLREHIAVSDLGDGDFIANYPKFHSAETLKPKPPNITETVNNTFENTTPTMPMEILNAMLVELNANLNA